MKRLCILLLILVVVPLAHAQKMPVTTTSDAARVHFVQGVGALFHVDNARALVHFDAALAADPDFALAHMYRAATTSAGRDEHMRQATTHAAKASEAERQQIEAYAAGLRGDRDRERTLLVALATRFPNDPVPMAIVANTEMSQGRSAEAVAAARRALAADPSFAPAYNTIGYAEMAQGNTAAAEKAFRDYIRLAPDEANPYDSMGEFYLNQGKLAEAEAQYKMALTKDPAFTNARTMLARIGIERSNQRLEEAVAKGDAAAIAAIYTANAIILPPDSPPIQGREAIQEYMKGLFAAGIDGLDVETVEVNRFDDIAIERANLTIKSGGKVVDRGKSLVVWRLVDGQWLYVRDMWSMNGPAQVSSN